MKSIKLMPDYECHPLWDASPDGFDNLDPDDLPIPAPLAERLHAWAAAYDATLDREDPRASGFQNEADEQAFNDEGARLVRSLDQALAGAYEVVSAYRR